MFVVDFDNYTCCVPYVIDGDTYFLRRFIRIGNTCICFLKKEGAMKPEYLDAEEKDLMEAFDSVDPAEYSSPSYEEQKKLKQAANEFISK
jgi:hypothetical protein